MARLEIVHNKKRKCITFFYGTHHWNIFDVEEGSGTLEMFGRVKYAIEHNFEIKMEEVED